MKKLSLVFAAIFSALMILSLTQPQQPQAATDDSLTRIQQKGTLIMGNSPNYPPYEFTTNVNGKEKIVVWTSKSANKLPRISASNWWSRKWTSIPCWSPWKQGKST
nr:hypothetical protein [Lacticaseibacillus suibinensis]